MNDEDRPIHIWVFPTKFFEDDNIQGFCLHHKIFKNEYGMMQGVETFARDSYGAVISVDPESSLNFTSMIKDVINADDFEGNKMTIVHFPTGSEEEYIELTINTWIELLNQNLNSKEEEKIVEEYRITKDEFNKQFKDLFNFLLEQNYITN